MWRGPRQPRIWVHYLQAAGPLHWPCSSGFLRGLNRLFTTFQATNLHRFLHCWHCLPCRLPSCSCLLPAVQRSEPERCLRGRQREGMRLKSLSCRRSISSPAHGLTGTDRSCRRANSSILTRLRRSTLRFSADLRSPSSNAIRAYDRSIHDPHRPCETYSHLCPFNLPLVPIAFPSTPFALEIVEHIREVHFGLARA
jgi:hypothetical protein